jgi:CheY-like chemotaxis protein
MIIKEPKNILIAGDSLLFRTKLSHIIAEVGHKVWIAGSGSEVLSEIKDISEELDLMVIDMQNVDINVYEVLESLNHEQSIKPSFILGITGAHDISHNLEHLKELGMNGVITKGFSPEQIIYRINRLLFSSKECDREEPRVPISIPLDFNVGDQSHTSFLLNISATGLFLYSKEELHPGTLLQARFVLPGSERVIDLKGIVRWSTKPGAGEEYFNGAGVFFTSITDEDTKRIRAFVQEELSKVYSEALLFD